MMLGTYLSTRRTKRGVSPEFLLAVSAGFGFGLANVFMKLMTWYVAFDTGAFNAVDLSTWAHIVTHLPFWLMVACIFPAFFFLQAAFAYGRVAVIMPLHVVFINAVVIVCALLVFNEGLNILRTMGIVASMGGAALLALESRKQYTRSIKPLPHGVDPEP
jgi:multidrug transporter EmrE-like cation transporter